MSRFVAPDLSGLPDLPLVEPDFEQTLAERMADFKARAQAEGFEYDVGGLESDPIKIDQEVSADREISIQAEINDQTRANMLAASWGPYLDHIAATPPYSLSRLIVTPATETEPAVLESDDDFKARIALAPEALSGAGPEGAYVFHALELDGQRDIADTVAYAEEDSATYSTGLHADAHSAGKKLTAFDGRGDGDLVISPEVLVVIAPTLIYGPVDQALLDRAFIAENPEDARPIGDNVRIEPAVDNPYQVVGKIFVSAGADKELIRLKATDEVQKYVDKRRRIGKIVQLLALGGALKITDVTEIELSEPVADIDPGSKGITTCTSITITAEIGEDTWRENP